MEFRCLLEKKFVILSALLASLAFVYPGYCAEFIFIFLVPLYYTVIMHTGNGFINGIIWGAIFYGIFFFDIFLLIIHKGNGAVRFFAVAFLWIYSALSSCLWVGFSNSLKIKNNNYKLLWLGITTWLYFAWVDTGFFLIFGTCSGNRLNHVVLPLAVRSAWLYFLPYVGKSIFLASVIGLSICFTALFSAYTPTKCFLTVLMSCIFLAGWYMPLTKQSAPSWLEKIGCVSLRTTDDSNHAQAAMQIAKAIETFTHNNPECSCIIMPESTFKFPLNLYKRYISLWQSDTLIVGSHRKEVNNLYNTLFHIQEGVITNCYDKNHLLFFTEQTPTIWSYIGGKALFLRDSTAFATHFNVTDFSVAGIATPLTPLICSELFFSDSHLKENKSFLCVVNDSWFEHSYLPRLMVYHAKITALLKKSSLIYSGYHYALFINPSGDTYPLACMNI